VLSTVEGIAAAAKRNPSGPALITGRQTLSYGNLLDAVARISNYLVRRGIPPRSKLFLNIADPDLRLIVTIAAMHAGFIPFVLLDIGGLAGQVDYDFVVAAPVPRLPDLRSDVTIDQSVFAGKLSDGTLRPFPDQPDDAILFVCSTSGSTGQPKLIAETFGGFRVRDRLRQWIAGEGDFAPQPWYGVVRGERQLSTLGDVTFAGVMAAIHTLSNGAVFVRASGDHWETLKVINLHGVDRLRTTPGILGEMMDVMDGTGTGCPSIRKMLLMGSLADRPLLERISRHFTAEIAVFYGASEIGKVSGGVVDAATFEAGYVGELFPTIRVATAGRRGDPTPLSLIFGPDSTYVPYYVNGKAVPPSGALYTLPDLGFVEDGRVYLVGRDDEVLNISGNKIAYSVIDQALRAMPGVRDVAVVGAAGLGDPLGLLIGVVGGPDADLAALGRRISEVVKAPETAAHVRLFRIDQIPRNAFGKTDRAGLTAAYRRATQVP
jgi:acyl-coenzyme A synthetase/AMP-(fatty) acid ligase